MKVQSHIIHIIFMHACNLIISQLIGARVQTNVHVQMATHTQLSETRHACMRVYTQSSHECSTASLTHTYVYAGAEQTLKDFQK